MSTTSWLSAQAASIEVPSKSSGSQWSIDLTVSVRADRSRLYSALTIPEYMEAWMNLPGSGEDGKVAIVPTDGGFCLVGAFPEGNERCIEAHYQVSRRGKLLLTWKNYCSENMQESKVAVRLLGDFARTNVQVLHTAIGSQEEYRWQRAFWEHSLHKLRLLF